MIPTKKDLERDLCWSVKFDIIGHKFEAKFHTREEARHFRKFCPNGFVRDNRKAQQANRRTR